MRVVADSHAIAWYVQGSSRVSDAAADALVEAEGTDGIVVSVATFIDLWYVTQTTQAVTPHDRQAACDARGVLDSDAASGHPRRR